MASRKTQQEMDKTFKKVSEGIQAFEGIFEKIHQSTNQAQKDKLEDNLKREIKKLQRQRDQIKTWAAGNEVKDKKPLIEQRKAIETCMEKFKAVEKEMKTKAYSKEGLSAAAKLDPREKEKSESCQFLSSMVEELERQVESLEAEEENLHATVKKGKRDTTKADRLAEISRILERHKWHQGKLELLLRSLENGNVEPAQVTDIQESIKFYVDSNQDPDFMEDDSLYDDFNLDAEEGTFGIANDNDRVSSQDTQSTQDDTQDTDGRGSLSGKSKAPDVPGTGARRPSTQMKSPLPALATLHTPLATSTSNVTNNGMKPAPLPTRPPGEGLKYASAAAAAAASEKNNLGIAPLPPPPGAAPSSSNGLPSASGSKQSVTPSPQLKPASFSQPHSIQDSKARGSMDDSSSSQAQSKSPTLSQSSAMATGSVPSTMPPTPALQKAENAHPPEAPSSTKSPAPTEPASLQVQTNGNCHVQSDIDELSMYHLPPGLQDLIQSFELTKSRERNPNAPPVQRLLGASHALIPGFMDSEKPKHYRPQTQYSTPEHFPQEPLTVFDDPRLYDAGRIETDTLFFIFYYRQNTYQQLLAAKTLKNQSWRFHKQYQTWFQRHEEPKHITEEFEQGTYRFFDYESTWMNRRKADFKFAYKFLEDDL
ncbi:MAG: general negative regulator of transcription subunit 5 [Cirrosporium novae-zelandiae]|nr:MAG: general negative regulator of transcription subunit 5 [Cirrosporium novae-zelandiae]